MVAGANVRRLLLVNFLVGRDPAGNTGDPLAASWIPAMALVCLSTLIALRKLFTLRTSLPFCSYTSVMDY